MSEPSEATRKELGSGETNTDFAASTIGKSGGRHLGCGCDVCGEEHETESCPLLGDGARVEDAVAPPRARLTMPSSLRARTFKDGTVTVVARENIPANTRFGPFEAPKMHPGVKAGAQTKFPLKVFNNKDDSALHLNTTDEGVCNWMCLVLPAESHKEQNLMAFQLLQNIFFSSKRDIRIHEELKVWYAPHYGKKMGVDPLIPTVTCDKESGLRDESEVAVEEPSPTHLIPKKRGRKRKISEEYVEIQDSTSSLGVDPKRLGSQAQRDWHCSQCSKIYNNCIDFARHLRDHYHPRKSVGERKRQGVADAARLLKSFECQFCPSKFRSEKLLQKHRLRLHRRQSRRNKTEKLKDVGVEGEDQKYMSECDAATILLEMEANCDATEEQQPESECGTAVLGIPSKAETIVSEQDDAAACQNTDEIVQCDATSYNDVLFGGKEVEPTEVVLEDFAQSTDAEIAANELTEKDDSASDSKGTSDDGEMTSDSKDVTVVVQASTDSTEKHDRDYLCDICSKSFDKSIYLFRHIRKHTGEFLCSKCQKSFARKESLSKHTCTDPITDDVGETLQKTFLCNYCHKSFESRHLLKRHVSKHTGDFTCDKCGKSYCSRDILENHVCSKNPNPGKYSCEICQKTFTKLKYLDKHIPVHTGAHACPICGKWLRSHDSLINHMRICGQVKDLEVNGLAPCPHCKKEFTDLQSFRRHLYEHTHLFACESCGARFRNKTTLSSHVCDVLGDSNVASETSDKTLLNSLSLRRNRLTHEDENVKGQDTGVSFDMEACTTGIPNQECKSETTETRTRKSLRRRPSLQPLICEVCGSLFSSTSSLNVHKRLHGEKLFSCEECGKRFHRKDLMLDHCAVHGEPAIPCPVCNKMFKTKKSLDVHLLIHDGVKRFTCDTCGKRFYQKGNLVKHEEVHNPHRKYPCNVCTKAFSTKEYLTIHVLEHTRGRIFTCSECDKSFVKEHQLKAHQRIFHTNLAYVCEFCGLHVKLKHSLKRHLSKKHADQQQLWNSGNRIQEMLVTQQELEAVEEQEFPNENETDTAVQETEVLLAVTRIRTEELQQALATGSAHFQQGSVPSTIEISLPIDPSLPDAIMVETGEDGEQLQTHIIQLPLATEQVRHIDNNDLSMIRDGEEENENQVQIAMDEASMDEAAGQGAHITVVNDFPQDGTLPEGTIVLENGTILQPGISDDGTDVLFYVFTSNDQDCNRALTGEEAN